MQTSNDNLVEVLNDLVAINYDRIKGYDRAASEAKEGDLDLQTIFNKMANESRNYVEELRDQVITLGGTPASDTTASGKIYRVWMDVKAMFTGSDRESLLSSCEFGEDEAQKAYDTALVSDADMDAETRQLIMKQKNSLKKSHDIIKGYRDLHEAVH